MLQTKLPQIPGVTINIMIFTVNMNGPFGGRVNYEVSVSFSIAALGSCGSIGDIISCPFRPGCSLDDKCGKCSCDDFGSEPETPQNPPLGSLCANTELCEGSKALIMIEKSDGRIETYIHDCGEGDSQNSFTIPSDYDPDHDRVFITCLPR